MVTYDKHTELKSSANAQLRDEFDAPKVTSACDFWRMKFGVMQSELTLDDLFRE